MGSGHPSGPARHNCWQHFINAGPGRQPRLVASWSAPFPARSLRATERGLGWSKKSAVPTADPPRRHSPKPSHTSLKFLTRTPSLRSPCPDHLTLPVRCYSGPVTAPAFRERQTGAPRPGLKSSPWPPSVSRSTDRVTQNNGIDPKPFWRLRAIPKEPHLIKPYVLRVNRAPITSGSCWYARGLFPHHHLRDEGGRTVHLPEIMLFQDASYQRV